MKSFCITQSHMIVHSKLLAIKGCWCCLVQSWSEATHGSPYNCLWPQIRFSIYSVWFNYFVQAINSISVSTYNGFPFSLTLTQIYCGSDCISMWVNWFGFAVMWARGRAWGDALREEIRDNAARRRWWLKGKSRGRAQHVMFVSSSPALIGLLVSLHCRESFEKGANTGQAGWCWAQWYSSTTCFICSIWELGHFSVKRQTQM